MVRLEGYGDAAQYLGLPKDGAGRLHGGASPDVANLVFVFDVRECRKAAELEPVADTLSDEALDAAAESERKFGRRIRALDTKTGRAH